ncbi:MAG: type II toxin-antitoxin system VapC family toxin [Prevotella sp.]|nr:type II toxin-antitoxin system VapC family toxin [Prevotella sp.]
MRFFLDTNILIFLWTKKVDELSNDITSLLKDYSNTLLTSSVCVAELIHLCQIGKVSSRKSEYKSPEDVKRWLQDAGITIVYITELNLDTYARLPMHADHRDPMDRLIIAQAISDRIPLVSSDHKFRLYESDGLAFVFNQR